MTACHKTSAGAYSATFKVTVSGGTNWTFAQDSGRSGDTAYYTHTVTPTSNQGGTPAPAPSIAFTSFFVSEQQGNQVTYHQIDLPASLQRSSHC